MKPFNSCYIAGPMTGIPEFNFPMFDLVAAFLREKLMLKVISPAEIDRADGFDEKGLSGNEKLTDEQRQQFARNDINALLKVDGIVFLPGWSGSQGARNEALIASWLGLHAFEVDYDDLIPSMSLRRIYLNDPWSSVQYVDEGQDWATPEEVEAAFAEVSSISDYQRGRAPTPNTRAHVLQTAEELVNGDRNNAYGDPLQDFQRTADFWNTYLNSGLDEYPHLNRDIGPEDVASMMALLKLSRIAWSPTKMDSWIDLAGYAACGAHCVVETTDPEEIR